jgi:hypothetical protein
VILMGVQALQQQTLIAGDPQCYPAQNPTTKHINCCCVALASVKFRQLTCQYNAHALGFGS